MLSLTPKRQILPPSLPSLFLYTLHCKLEEDQNVEDTVAKRQVITLETSKFKVHGCRGEQEKDNQVIKTAEKGAGDRQKEKAMEKCISRRVQQR